MAYMVLFFRNLFPICILMFVYIKVSQYTSKEPFYLMVSICARPGRQQLLENSTETKIAFFLFLDNNLLRGVGNYDRCMFIEKKKEKNHRRQVVCMCVFMCVCVHRYKNALCKNESKTIIRGNL